MSTHGVVHGLGVMKLPAVQSGQYLPGQVTRVQLACQADDTLAAGGACRLR